jgi:hypothetical protein
MDGPDVTTVAPEWKSKIETTLEDWRRYLLDLQSRPKGVHHLLVVGGVPDEVPADSHPKTLHYLRRAADGVVLDGTHNLAVYVKLLRSIFYAPIFPINPGGWVGTRIFAGPGTMGQQHITMKQFGGFVQSRVKLIMDAPLSDQAQSAVLKTMLKDPQRVADSESLEVHRATEELWGSD